MKSDVYMHTESEADKEGKRPIYLCGLPQTPTIVFITQFVLYLPLQALPDHKAFV